MDDCRLLVGDGEKYPGSKRKDKKRKENTMMRKKGRTNEACRDVCELSIEESAKSSSVSESILSLVHSLPIHGTTRSTRGRKPCYRTTNYHCQPVPAALGGFTNSPKGVVTDCTRALPTVHGDADFGPPSTLHPVSLAATPILLE